MNPPQSRWAACLLVLCCAGVQAQWLVSEEEARLSRAAPQMPEAKALPGPDAPRIVLLLPDLSAQVASPTRIQLRFEPGPDGQIRPDTFKVRYGTFRLDITSRITAASKVTVQGIDVAEASLPKGSHRLFLEIQDSQGRVGERTLSFVVP
jgi:hypothetical protein